MFVQLHEYETSLTNQPQSSGTESDPVKELDFNADLCFNLFNNHVSPGGAM